MVVIDNKNTPSWSGVCLLWEAFKYLGLGQRWVPAATCKRTKSSALARFWTPASLPGGINLWQGVDAFVSFAVISLLFAVIYKVLPVARISWTAVWIGQL